MTLTTIDYNNYTTVNEAAPWWQTLGIAAFGGVLGGGLVLLLVLLFARSWVESSIDRAYDDGTCDCFACVSDANLPTLDTDDTPGWFARLRDRFRSHHTEDASDDREYATGGWLPPPRNQVLGDDGELHPIDEAAQLQEQENADAKAP